MCLMFNRLFTQFLTNDGTDSGDLAEIRRVYVQAIFHRTDNCHHITGEEF